MTAAATIPVEKRHLFLQRIADMMKFRSRSDQDLVEVVALALAGLKHPAA